MSGDPQSKSPPITDAAEETAQELRDKIGFALQPAGPVGPGVSILDRCMKVAILISTEPATVKSLAKMTGFRPSLVGDVLSGLIEAGTVTQAGGNYRIPRPLDPVTSENQLTAAWRRLELSTDCPKCDAPAGEVCISKSSTYTTLHSERRKAAMNSGPSAEAIAA